MKFPRYHPLHPQFVVCRTDTPIIHTVLLYSLNSQILKYLKYLKFKIQNCQFLIKEKHNPKISEMTKISDPKISAGKNIGEYPPLGNTRGSLVRTLLCKQCLFTSQKSLVLYRSCLHSLFSYRL